MGSDSALYQLMDIRMNGVMNSIVSSDGEYQAILRKSDTYSGELDRTEMLHPQPFRPVPLSFLNEYPYLQFRVPVGF